MHHAALTALLLWVPLASAADALRISQIEQDLRRLQTQLQDQARQIESLRLQLSSRAGVPEARLPSSPAPSPGTAWVDAARWARIQPGMAELEVITLLGPPTSMRAAEGGRLLNYAMEIGTSGFLAGSVQLRDGQVTVVELPRLR